MRILLVTDHKFLQYQERIYDVFRIDQEFFKDYTSVFEKVSVLARLVNVTILPEGAKRSDGNCVAFIPGIFLAHRASWVLSSKIMNFGLLKRQIAASDGVIVRVPSELGTHAANEAWRQDKPLLAEVVGDPEESIGNMGRGGIHYKILAAWEDHCLRRITEIADAASYVSKYSLQRKYPVRPGVHSVTISSVRLDEEDITEPRLFADIPIPLKIVYLANLIPHKRHIDLLKACQVIQDQGIAVEVHLAGDGFLREDLNQAVHDMTMTDSVVFHGHIPSKQAIFDLLDSCDLFVMPSASEGVPRAVLEAMARGLPAIGSDAGGIPEIIRESDIFAVGDVQNIIQLINDVRNDPQRLTEMSKYSIQTANEFTSKVLSKKRRDLYRYFVELTEKRSA